VLAYFSYWALTFVAVVIAVVGTAIIYRWMDNGLDLNGWLEEIITAFVVSAGQAGGYLIQQHFHTPQSYIFRFHGGGSIAAPIFILCLWLGYKITRLTTWDPLEYFVLGILDAVLILLGLLVI
jgi:hypothetical protein